MDLLENLTRKSNCMYLSDLKLSSRAVLLVKALKTVSPESYSLKEWQDAVEYILPGGSDFSDKKEAREYLIRELQKKVKTYGKGR